MICYQSSGENKEHRHNQHLVMVCKEGLVLSDVQQIRRGPCRKNPHQSTQHVRKRCCEGCQESGEGEEVIIVYLLTISTIKSIIFSPLIHFMCFIYPM